MKHQPVLLKEVLDLLAPAPNENFIDATFGAGGHTLMLLQKIQPNGKVLAIDASELAVEGAGSQFQNPDFKSRLILAHGNFVELKQIASERGFADVSGVLFDLGLSTDELDDPSRGFSFQTTGPLDMRFDQTQKLTVERILNAETEKNLKNIFLRFGEEKFSGRIAKAIFNTRRASKLSTTSDLFNIIKSALPSAVKHKANDVARRIFQALRIAVNRELENLEIALPQALAILKPGGRLAVISFHSLEDRIVKRFFLKESRGCVCPPEFPECVCGKNPSIKILTKKPVMASEEEVAVNSRAKPAKLRAAVKL
ncbi:MAG: 16S rRNA (cytosine(1402)-N(4))-methyltransferase RsmH [Patescibacteria group bacterium]